MWNDGHCLKFFFTKCIQEKLLPTFAKQCRQQQVKWNGKIYVSKIGLVAVNGREMEDLSWNSNIVSVALQLFAFKFWIYINQSINQSITKLHET